MSATQERERKMTTKHTPGPWEVLPDGFRVYRIQREREDIKDLTHICHTAHNNKERTYEARANAILIAAAPELLAALEAVKSRLAMLQPVVCWTQQDQDAVTNANAVIAKATPRM